MVKKKQITCASCGALNKAQFQYCSECGNYLNKNYFDVLEVSWDADLREIRKAYLKAAAKCHPDKTANLSEELKKLADSKMRQLNYIWDILKEPERRAEYIDELEQEAAEEQATEDRSLIGKLWRRFLARLIDYLLFGFFISAPLRWLFSLVADAVPPDSTILQYLLLTLFLLILGTFATFLWVFIEAALLSKVMVTPGKWLMRLSVVNNEEGALRFADALARSRIVWLKGAAGGIFFLLPITSFFWYKKAKQEESFPWDNAAGSEVQYNQVSRVIVAAAAIILAQFAVLGLLDLRNIGPDTPSVTTDKPASPSSDEVVVNDEEPAPENSDIPSTETVPTTRKNIAGETPDSDIPSTETAPATRQSIAGETPDSDIPSTETAPATRQSIAGETPDSDIPSTEAAPATRQSIAGETPETKVIPQPDIDTDVTGLTQPLQTEDKGSQQTVTSTIDDATTQNKPPASPANQQTVSATPIDPATAVTDTAPEQTVPVVAVPPTPTTTTQESGTATAVKPSLSTPQSANSKSVATTTPVDQPLPKPPANNETPSSTSRKVAVKISEQQRVECMTQYFGAMTEATGLPLGDYARADRAARKTLERCLRGG